MDRVMRWVTPVAVIAMVAAYYLWPRAFVFVWAFVMSLIPINLALWVGDVIRAFRNRPA
ncbi:MAG TPA: hypothetical protein PLR76_12445 [Hyphomonas sp.]|nr:hypothetical protein [Hyphomonas sp.]MCA8906095.1 hypothetical protein [Hyphomonas sp.]MCB9961245.1 hypothetical protein [Hyphomonas sp.]MCB9970536.1 hypothetical protein [Hyphomonas sp.]HPE49206.1 hypothetical protein [Hyphomonas sp.]